MITSSYSDIFTAQRYTAMLSVRRVSCINTAEWADVACGTEATLHVQYKGVMK